MSGSISDEELMSKVKVGEVEAFEILLARYRKPLFSFIFRMLGDFHKAQDIFQETFFRVFRYAYRYDESQKFSSWLYRIAHNLCIGEMRKRKRSETIFEEKDAKELVEHPDEMTPNKELENKEMEQIIEKAILKLTESQREVLILREYQKLSYEEIAQITSMSIPAVKSCLHRARMALLDIIAPYFTHKKDG